ncbi:MAG: class I SAM-dependent methyltransferase, partial [Thermoanaerobaculia bacterium]
MRRCASCEATLEGGGWNCRICGFAPSMVDGVAVLAPELARSNPDDANYSYSELDHAQRSHFWFTNRSRLIAWVVKRYVPGATSFFDVGCGTGGVLEVLKSSLPGVRLAGADALLAGLAFARRQLPDVGFVQVDIRKLPYDREFDIVGAFDVLEHLDDDEQALREMYRSTAVGGRMIVTVPQHQFLWSALDDYSHHRRRYSRRQMIRAVERAGYVVERATSFMTLTLPAQLASRMRKQNLAALDPAAEMRINPLVNTIFGALCGV